MADVSKGVLRRGARALRSFGPGTVAVAVALIIGAAGFADAATGGNFILGKGNTESSTAVMTDSTGIPLSLNAPSGKSPFSVNSTTQVNRLNAQYVGGDSAAQLQSAGGEGMTNVDVESALTGAYVPIASTGALAAGTYYVNAAALLVTGTADAAYCEIESSTGKVYGYGGGGGSPGAYTQAAETAVVAVTKGWTLSEACVGDGSNQSVYNAAITAIRVNSSSAGTVPTILPRGAVAHHIVGGPAKAKG